MKIECKLHYNATVTCSNVKVLSGALICEVNLYYHFIPDNGDVFGYDDYDTGMWVYHGKKIDKWDDRKAIIAHYKSLGIDLNELILEQLPNELVLNAVVMQQMNK